MNTQQSRQEVTVGAEAPLAVKSIREDLDKMEKQFKYALPPHIPVERFIRVVMTAVQNNTRLMRCTRQSLFNACMRAAQDGLLPDGREGAIVPYGEDEDGRGKSDVAQWMPMIAGLRKKVRNSGLLTDWNVQVVQEGDAFEYQLGDDPFIRYKKSAKGGRTRKVLWAFSIARYPDGTKSYEVMNVDEIEDIRKKSKAKRGPWSDPVFYPEMCRKTVARLHSKQLPQSTDLDRVLHRDDELYDFTGARDQRQAMAPPPRPASVAAALDSFGGSFETAASETSTSPAEDTPSKSTAGGEEGGGGEQQAPDSGASESAARVSETPATETSAPAPAADPAITQAYERGRQAKAQGVQRRAVPGEYREASAGPLFKAWIAGWDGTPL